MIRTAFTAALALALSLPAWSQELTRAEVRKVDKDAKKITLKHDEIKHLDMPGMTMVFTVKDAALLEKAKAGDKVMVRVEKEGGSYVVTVLEAAKP